MNKESIKKKIQTFSSLEHNWDGYGAESFSEYLIIGFLNIVDLLPDDIEIKNPWVVPGPGGVQLEWENGKKALEMEMREDLVGFLQVDMSKEEKKEDQYIETEIPISSGMKDIQIKIRELLEWLIK